MPHAAHYEEMNFICKMYKFDTHSYLYLASTDGMVLLLHNFLDRSLFFVCNKYKSPPLLSFWILWQLNGLNLKEKVNITLKQPIHYICLNAQLAVELIDSFTSPKAPKYSSITSLAVSGLRPPTKIFLTGSFFIAMAFLGSICRPSNRCSFCSRTYAKKIHLLVSPNWKHVEFP